MSMALPPMRPVRHEAYRRINLGSGIAPKPSSLMFTEFVCRQCGSRDLRSWGRLPRASRFAGQDLQHPVDGGTLFECRSCGLGLRIPTLEPKTMERLYAQAAENVWSASELRHDQAQVLRHLAEHITAGDILDVGCYDGSLLAAAGSQYRSFGVEASTRAATVARNRGVQIVAEQFSQIDELTQCFDAICAVDVIEHVLDPLVLLRCLARRVKQAGIILVSTGDFAAPAWRATGSQYWYCSYPEHVSFVSEAWARQAAPQCGLEFVTAYRFRYGAGRVGQTEDAQSDRQFRVAAAKSRVKRRLLDLVPGKPAWAAPRTNYGCPGMFVDHLLLAFRPQKAM